MIINTPWGFGSGQEGTFGIFALGGTSGITSGIEVGAGKVLMGLMRGINREVKVSPVESKESFNAYKG